MSAGVGVGDGCVVRGAGTAVGLGVDKMAMYGVWRTGAGQLGGFGRVEGDLDPVVASTVSVAFLKRGLGQDSLQFGAVEAHALIVALMGRMAVVVLVDATVGYAFKVLDGGPLVVEAKAEEDNFGGFFVDVLQVCGDVGVNGGQRESRLLLLDGILGALVLHILVKYSVLVLRILQSYGVLFACWSRRLAAGETPAARRSTKRSLFLWLSPAA